MQQHSQALIERRSETRQPMAFAFWLHPPDSHGRTSAWMFNMSARGAAFLTAVDDAPPVGQRVELIEMQTTDRTVREGAGPLPRFARVLRHDDTEGVTRRVAVQFESDAWEPLREPDRHTATACLPQSRVVPSPPPAKTEANAGFAFAPGKPRA